MNDQTTSRVSASIPAGFWIRVCGLLLDGCLYSAVMVFGLSIIGSGRGKAAMWPIFALLFVCITCMIAIWGQTPGMALCGIQARNLEGNAVGWPRAIIRSFGFILSQFLYLGFLVATLNRERRTFHDFIAGTKVVYGNTAASAMKSLKFLGYIGIGLFPIAMWLRVRTPSIDRQLTMPGRGTSSQQISQISIKMKHAQALGELGRMRETIYRQTKGWKEPEPTTVSGVLELQLPDHEANRIVTIYGPEACKGWGADKTPVLVTDKIKDTGGWGYISARGTACDGHLFFDCTHIDSQNGRPYSDR